MTDANELLRTFRRGMVGHGNHSAKATIMDFNPSEISTICLFFGVLPTPDIFELTEHHTLESCRVDHPSGDRLEVLPGGYMVTIADDHHPYPYYFARNFGGLLEALECLTQSTS